MGIVNDEIIKRREDNRKSPKMPPKTIEEIKEMSLRKRVLLNKVDRQIDEMIVQAKSVNVSI
jgi:hypothetical protein